MGRRSRRNKQPVEVKADSVEREDDYVNPYTGIGDYTQDKMFGGRSSGPDFFVREFTRQDAENRWRGSDLAARIIEAIPDEMMREGWELSIQTDDDDPDDDEDMPEEDKATTERDDAFGGPPANPIALLGAPKNVPRPFEPADDEPKQMAEDMAEAMDELGAEAAILRALHYERAYGGAAIMVGADDGLDPVQPLNEDNIGEVKWLNVFSGGVDGELIAWSYYRDPKSAKYGMPETYQVRNLGVPVQAIPVPGQTAAPPSDGPTEFATTNPQSVPNVNAAAWYVHESRLLIFSGPSVSHRARVQSKGWGDSVFVRVDEVLSQFSQTWGGVANLMAQFHQDVLKMSGLAVGLAGGNKASKGSPLVTRARTMQQTKSMARMLVIDAEEEFQRETAQLGGVKDILEQFSVRLSSAAETPMEILFTATAGGLNKGDSSLRGFYDRIANRQKRHLLPALKRLYCLLFKAKKGPTKGVEPPMWNIKFNPLYQLTELERATLRKTVAETDQIYITQGVLSPEEVAQSAYGGSEWSMERTVDLEGRQKMADQADADAEERKNTAMEMMKVAPPAAEPANGVAAKSPVASEK